MSKPVRVSQNQRRVIALRAQQKSLKQNIARLKVKSRDIRSAIAQQQKELSHDTTHAQLERYKQWHSSQLSIGLTSDEPGILTAVCSFHADTGTFTKRKDFNLLNVCQTMKYCSPLTIDVWRENIQIVAKFLDEVTAQRNKQAS